MNQSSPVSGLLWIGDHQHHSMRDAWRVCQAFCDGISFRESLQDAVGRPPRLPYSHVVVAQTNRHEIDTLAIDDRYGLNLAGFRDASNGFCKASKCLVLRGPLVAPAYRLPIQSPSVNGFESAELGDSRVTSISWGEAAAFLPFWLSNDRQMSVASRYAKNVGNASFAERNATMEDHCRPIVFVSRSFDLAESYLDCIENHFQSRHLSSPTLSWQADLNRRSFRGPAIILWDDTVLEPTEVSVWRSRISDFATSKNVWLTANATPRQRQLALDVGIAEILEKPGRMPCVLHAINNSPIF